MRTGPAWYGRRRRRRYNPRVGTGLRRGPGARGRVLAALLAASSGCGDGQAAPGAAPAPAPAAPPPSAAAPPVLSGAAPAPPRARIPARPRDEAERLAGLVRLLEWGDSEQVRFAQAAVAAYPDPVAAAAAVERAGDANFRRNSSFVGNLLGCVRSAALGRPLGEFLLRCTRSPDGAVRRLALTAYAETAAFPSAAVLAPLAADGEYPVSRAALEALQRCPRGEAAQALRAILPKVDPSSRPVALLLLGDLGDAAAVPILLEELARARAGGPEAGAAFVGAAAGLAALGRVEGTEALRAWVLALPPSVPPGLPEERLAAAGDPGLRTRLCGQARGAPALAAGVALALLARYPEGEETAAAVLAAAERPEMEVILEALTVLRSWGRADAMTRTLAALEAPEPDRRYAAALALGRFRDPATVVPLARRLAADGNEAVRFKVADALGILADARGAAAVVAFLCTEDAPSPDRALRAFTAQNDLRGAMAEAAAPAVLALVEEGPPPAILAHAVRVLGRAPGAAGARSALERRLAHPDPAVRAAVAAALGDLGDRAARDALAARYAGEPDDGVAESLRDAILRLDLRNP